MSESNCNFYGLCKKRELYMKKKMKYVLIFTLICAAFTMIFVLSKTLKEKPLEVPSDAENIIEVPRLCQHPKLPSGCEATSAVMVLQYYGEKIKPEKFIEKWLGYNDDFYEEKGKFYGPDPNEIFAGDPFTEYAFGCYAPAIVRAVNEHSKVCVAEEIRGVSLEVLCERYVANDQPILIWATMDMQDPAEGRTWYFEDGTEFTWIAREHCMVLIGYDEDYYFFNDPESGNALAYHKAVVEEKYKELGSQAVLIQEK